MEDELESLEPDPSSCSSWSATNKGKAVKHKAKVVAQGYTQRVGQYFDDVYAPVTRHATFCTFLTIAAKWDTAVKHLDIKTATFTGFLWRKCLYASPSDARRKGSRSWSIDCREVSTCCANRRAAGLSTSMKHYRNWDSSNQLPIRVCKWKRADEQVSFNLYMSMTCLWCRPTRKSYRRCFGVSVKNSSWPVWGMSPLSRNGGSSRWTRLQNPSSELHWKAAEGTWYGWRKTCKITCRSGLYKSRGQASVTLSFMEVEYVAFSEAYQVGTTTTKEENQGSLAFVRKDRSSRRSKHWYSGEVRPGTVSEGSSCVGILSN